jgi:hypothetical protein
MEVSARPIVKGWTSKWGDSGATTWTGQEEGEKERRKLVGFVDGSVLCHHNTL